MPCIGWFLQYNFELKKKKKKESLPFHFAIPLHDIWNHLLETGYPANHF